MRNLNGIIGGKKPYSAGTTLHQVGTYKVHAPPGYSFLARLLHGEYTLKNCLDLLVDYFIVVEDG